MTRTPIWKWLLGTFLILSLWIYCAAIIAFGLDAAIAGDDPWQSLLRELATFIPFFVATPFVWRKLLRRPVATLINDSGGIKTRRIAHGFVVWFALSVIGTGVDFLMHPNAYHVSFEASAFYPFLAVTVLLLPVQSWAEEFFFRGWLLRWAAQRSIVTRAVLSGVVFAAPHLSNPEAAQDTALAFASWFVLGAGWAYVSAREGGIELAMGAHLANNFFSLIFVGYADAALPTASIFSTGSLNMLATFVTLAVSMPVFIRLTRP